MSGNVVFHLSDLNFGNANFSDTLKEKIITQVENQDPEIILISGDLTQNGSKKQYMNAKSFINTLKGYSTVYAVPGDNDVHNIGLSFFETMINPRNFIYTDDDLAVIGLDSATNTLNSGYIGLDQLRWFEEQVQDLPDNFFTIVMFHHHLLPLPHQPWEGNVLLDAGDVLQRLKQNNVDVVLHGHTPNHYNLKVNDMNVFAAGTPTKPLSWGVNHYYSLLIDENFAFTSITV